MSVRCPGCQSLRCLLDDKMVMAEFDAAMTTLHLPPKPLGLARQIDGLDLLEANCAFLDEVVQIAVRRTSDLHAVNVDLHRSTMITLGPGRGIANAIHSGRHPVLLLVERLLDVLTCGA